MEKEFDLEQARSRRPADAVECDIRRQLELLRLPQALLLQIGERFMVTAHRYSHVEEPSQAVTRKPVAGVVSAACTRLQALHSEF